MIKKIIISYLHLASWENYQLLYYHDSSAVTFIASPSNYGGYNCYPANPIPQHTTSHPYC